MTQPLANKRILVTRAAHQAGKLSEGLRALGAVPVEVPVLEIQPPASFDPLDGALRKLSTYDWLIFTSANAVRAVVERAASCGIVFSGRTPVIAAVGKATADAAREAGFTVAITPKEYVAESLIEALAEHGLRKRVLLARAAIARDVIPDALRAQGAFAEVVDAYQNSIPAAAPEQLRAALAEHLDAATFTSSSSATHLAEVARAADVAFPFADVPAISIGPITSATLREFGWEPDAEAHPHNIAGLIAATAALLVPPVS
ncbi:MAG TPA: uroporphyrinogen-III synthase [Terracidiphilus sp.]|nr:uroporphyrinogen-III synthase [Terracidiphilus sp.]